MRFSTFLLAFFACLVALVAAAPTDEFGLTEVEGAPPSVKPEGTDPTPSADGGDTLVGGDGETTGVTKRYEYNPLVERGRGGGGGGGGPHDNAVLILCESRDCREGRHQRCWAVDLNRARFDVCYGTRPYNSVFVESQHGRGLDYGVYVGDNCRRRKSSFQFIILLLDFYQVSISIFDAKADRFSFLKYSFTYPSCRDLLPHRSSRTYLRQARGPSRSLNAQRGML